MTPPRSTFARRAAVLAAVVLAALSVALPVVTSSAIPTASSSSTAPAAVPQLVSQAPTITVSLLASAPTVPTGGTFGYTADIRLRKPASYLQAVLEVSKPSGTLLFKRTKVANNLKHRTAQFSFERALTDVLALEPGVYPVSLAVAANVGGSAITTETTTTLRVYSPAGTKLKIALLARVNGAPMMAPDGRFAIDPAVDTRARDAVEAVCRRVLTDPSARITLAMPPVLLAEWRRLSGGYTMTDGRVVRPSDPAPVAYNSTLADLKAAIDSKRLELMSLGYADPNLTDLANHGQAADVGPQYDAGISAVFASLQATPSGGTAPSAGCMPPNQIDILAQKGVRYIALDTDCVGQKQEAPAPGVYPVSRSKMIAIAVDETQTAILSAGNPNPALQAAFERLVHDPKQPLVFEVDITSDAMLAPASAGLALNAFETQPWLQIVSARTLRPSDSVDHVRLVPGKSTPGAPKRFWRTVGTARTYADAYYTALGPSAPEAVTAVSQSLVAESSAWAGDDANWAAAGRGLGFASASLKTTRPIMDGVSVSVQPVTLSGATGEVPVTIVNDSDKTLNVVVSVRSSGGLRVTGTQDTPTTLRPQETYIQVPVAMTTALSGKLSVSVVSEDLVLSRKIVTVHASALDRLALGAFVVLVLLGMLIFIVRRERRALAEERRAERYTDADADADERAARSSER